jgi:hypothetical protein
VGWHSVCSRFFHAVNEAMDPHVKKNVQEFSTA